MCPAHDASSAHTRPRVCPAWPAGCRLATPASPFPAPGRAQSPCRSHLDVPHAPVPTRIPRCRLVDCLRLPLVPSRPAHACQRRRLCLRVLHQHICLRCLSATAPCRQLSPVPVSDFSRPNCPCPSRKRFLRPRSAHIMLGAAGRGLCLRAPFPCCASASDVHDASPHICQTAQCLAQLAVRFFFGFGLPTQEPLLCPAAQVPNYFDGNTTDEILAYFSPVPRGACVCFAFSCCCASCQLHVLLASCNSQLSQHASASDFISSAQHSPSPTSNQHRHVC